MRDLQLDTPGAWKSFFIHVTRAFPLIAAAMQEDRAYTDASFHDDGCPEADSIRRLSEAELLRDLAEHFKREAAVLLGQLCRSLGQAPLPRFDVLGQVPREACALQALAMAHKLELDCWGDRNDGLSKELLYVTEELEKVKRIQGCLDGQREALSRQREARMRSAREAEELMVSIENLCKRLRLLRGQRRALERRAAARTCRAEDPCGVGDAALVFRGGHRLLIFDLDDAHDSGLRDTIRLRFEPWLPDRKELPDASQVKMVDRLEDLLARVWLQATASVEQQSLVVEVSAAEVPDIVQRLDLSLLSAAVLVCKVVKASFDATGGRSESSKRRRLSV